MMLQFSFINLNREQDHEVRLIWDINILNMDMSINICEQVIPNIRMEAYTTGSRKSYNLIMQMLI